MRNTLKSVFAAFSLTVLAGCATSTLLNVTYHSDPQGAALYEGGRFFGYTPVTLQYPLAHLTMETGQCVAVQPLAVRWASGAEASIENLQACPINGYFQQFSFIRPTGVAGREMDVQFALERERLAIMQQQANAQEMANLSALFWQLNQQTQQIYNRPSNSVNCTTQVFGSTIQTSCR